MKTLPRILLSTAALALTVGVAVPAHAVVKWNFVNAQCVSCNDTSREFEFFSKAGSDPTPGTVTATGWANTEPGSSNNTLAQGSVPEFGSSGIGVINGAAAYEGEGSSSGEHGVDNVDRFDLVLFEFEDSVSVTEVGIGWFSEDADISLLAWVGGDPGDTPDIAGVDYSASSEGLTDNGWELIGNFDVDTTDPDPDQGNGSLDFVQAVDTDVSSSWWIVAAYNPVFAAGPNEAHACCNETHPVDKMKILSLAGTIDTPTPPDSGVPAPASLLLVLGGMAPMLRRRHARS